MGNAGSRGFQDGVVSKKEMERMHRRSDPAGNNNLCVACLCEIIANKSTWHRLSFDVREV